MKPAGIHIIFLFLFIAACDLNVENPAPDPVENPEYANWLIPKNRVLIRKSAGSGIPPIDDPQFQLTSETDFMADNDLIIGVSIDGSIRAYPLRILNRHEVVNDEFLQHDVLISYSPLSGTAAVWDRGDLKGFNSRFIISNFIYNSNHILVDEETSSHWLPLGFECVNGSLEGFDPYLFPVIKTTWQSWKLMFPGTKVLSLPTGYPYDYMDDPYEQFGQNDSIPYPTSPLDGRLSLKEEVHAIVVNNRLKVYPETLFTDSTRIIMDNFQGVPFVIAGNRLKSYIVSFESSILPGTELQFTAYDSGSANMIMKDEAGNIYDPFGLAVDGPDTGRRLKPSRSVTGYWYSLAAIYPDPVIYR